MMHHHSDEYVLAQMERKYQDAKSCGKEGKGTHRNAGDSGNVAAEWMRWRNEAIKRGLVQ